MFHQDVHTHKKRKLLVKSELITKVSSNVLNTRQQKQHPIIVWGFMVISEEIMCAVSFLVPELWPLIHGDVQEMMTGAFD